VTFVVLVVVAEKYLNLNVRITGDDDHELDKTADNGKYYWHKADFEGLQLTLSQIDWNTFICFSAEGSSVWSHFLNVLWASVNEFVPHYSGSSQRRDVVTKCRRYPNHLRKLLAKKQRLWKELRKDHSDK